ncbi:MAG: hypothetical protein KIT34_06740 [Cyanobacteria bacterium TGS_CYA1]|nr:hypothetical protein [Cyanobacteria bacterium TGS_CYA1]
MKNILSKVLLALSAILIFAEVLLYLGRFYVALSSDLPIDYEGPTYFGVRQLASNCNIYDANTLKAAPFMVTIYMPLYYGLCAILQSFLDIGSGLKVCRLISILSLVWASYSAFRIFKISQIGQIRSILGVFVFLNFFALWIWSNYCRVDMLATALSLFALERFIALQTTDEKAQSIKSLIVPILFCAAALYTKQSSFVVAFSIFVYLLWRKRWKESIFFAVALAAVCALLFVLLQAITGGGFLAHMKFASRMPYDWTMMMDHLGWIGLDWLKILIVAASSLVLLIFGKRNTEQKSYFALSLPFLFSTAIFTLYTLGTEYPNTNHAILFYFTLVWIFMQVSHEYRQRQDQKQECVYSISLVLSSLLGCVLMFSLLPSMLLWPGELNASKKQLDVLTKFKPQSLIFTEDPYLSLVSNTKPLFVDVSTFVQVWHKERKEAWQNDLIDLVNQKKLEAVIINCHDDQKEKPSYYWSADLVDSIHQKYRLNSSLTGNRQAQNVYLQAN